MSGEMGCGVDDGPVKVNMGYHKLIGGEQKG